MAAALAKDLRVRVMGDVDAGMSAEKAAVKYSVSARTIYHWKALRRETGVLKPRAGKTGPKPKLAAHRERILAAVREDSAITLNDLRAKLQLPGCVSTLWLALWSWGIVLKKCPAGQLTTTAGCRREASLVGSSDDASPTGSLCISRRNGGEHEDGSIVRLGSEVRAGGLVGSSRTLEDDDLCGRVADDRPDRSGGDRWRDER